ncbi:hypothetical protein COB52_01920 [Candidatus Kaiserbacteria bacterium]|nr:MAG: hypothetical protein COB52_01920 [Candidatus Kaiserbacteria bacterium]
MESQIKSSFIPDKMPARQPGRTPKKSSGGVGDILILITVVILAASLALAAGVFLYDRFLTVNVDKKAEQLNRARQALDEDSVKQLLRLDARLMAASSVLTNHTAPSEIFKVLQETTLKSVSYDSFEYTAGGVDGMVITLKGKAKSVNGVALQASVFGQHNAIGNPIFSEIDLISDGVSFIVTANINPSAINYTNVSQYVSEVVDVPVEEDFGEFGGSNDVEQ